MTDATENADSDDLFEQEGRPGAGGPRRLLIIGGVIAGLLLAAGGAAFALAQSGLFQSDEAGSTPVAAAEAYFYDLPEITVNLNTGGGAAEYLRVMASLEVRDKSMIPIIEPRMPRVLDAFQVYLRELRRSDLEGSAGVYRIKEELQRRVNMAVHPAVVDDVLFKEILVQ